MILRFLVMLIYHYPYNLDYHGKFLLDKLRADMVYYSGANLDFYGGYI